MNEKEKFEQFMLALMEEQARNDKWFDLIENYLSDVSLLKATDASFEMFDSILKKTEERIGDTTGKIRSIVWGCKGEFPVLIDDNEEEKKLESWQDLYDLIVSNKELIEAIE